MYYLNYKRSVLNIYFGQNKYIDRNNLRNRAQYKQT